MKQLLKSVVREICTLRSVGAGARATAPGHPVGSQQWLSLPRSTVIQVQCRGNGRKLAGMISESRTVQDLSAFAGLSKLIFTFTSLVPAGRLIRRSLR